MIIATLPLIVCLVGGVVYLVVANGKAAELGRIAFFVGLLWLVYAAAGRGLHI